MLLGALGYWLPDTLVHAQWVNFNGRDVTIVTVVAPLLLLSFDSACLGPRRLRQTRPLGREYLHCDDDCRHEEDDRYTDPHQSSGELLIFERGNVEKPGR